MAKKRRQHSAQFKFEVVMTMLHGEQTVAEVCRQYDITESLAYKWRDQFLEQAPDIFKDHRQKDQAAADKEARIAELERLVGRLTLEKEILEKYQLMLKKTTRTCKI